MLAESAANSGITGLMTKMLLKGTASRTAEQIASEIESVGGSIDTYAGNNSFGVTLEVLEDDLALGFDLLSDVLRRPSVSRPRNWNRETAVQLAGIRAQKDQLLQLAARAMRRSLFGELGYGLDAQGSEESVGALTLEQLAAFHRRLTVPNNGPSPSTAPSRRKQSGPRWNGCWATGPRPIRSSASWPIRRAPRRRCASTTRNSRRSW